jgi:hypothetical protein
VKLGQLIRELKNNWRQQRCFWRRMLKVPWADKITNENTLKQVNEKRKTIKELSKKQSRFIGYILGKGKLENIVTK